MSYYKNCQAIESSISLNEDQKEAIFRSKLLEDAKNSIIEYAKEMLKKERIEEIEFNFIKTDAEELAEKYLTQYKNFSTSEEDSIEETITTYLEEEIREYEVPVKWICTGYVKVKAKSPVKAVEYAQENLDLFDIPLEFEYASDSFKLAEETFDLNVEATEPVQKYF